METETDREKGEIKERERYRCIAASYAAEQPPSPENRRGVTGENRPRCLAGENCSLLVLLYVWLLIEARR